MAFAHETGALEKIESAETLFVAPNGGRLLVENNSWKMGVATESRSLYANWSYRNTGVSMNRIEGCLKSQ
jgi:hypothetical protein